MQHIVLVSASELLTLLTLGKIRQVEQNMMDGSKADVHLIPRSCIMKL